MEKIYLKYIDENNQEYNRIYHKRPVTGIYVEENLKTWIDEGTMYNIISHIEEGNIKGSYRIE